MPPSCLGQAPPHRPLPRSQARRPSPPYTQHQSSSGCSRAHQFSCLPSGDRFPEPNLCSVCGLPTAEHKAFKYLFATVCVSGTKLTAALEITLS